MQPPTVPYSPDAPHHRLLHLVGAFQGVAKTYLDPSSPPLEAPFEGTITPRLGGRFVQLDYRSSVNDAPIAGSLLLAFESGEGFFRATWIDSFHTGTAVLVSTGRPGDTGIDVRGTYFVEKDAPHWGWRTRIDDAREGELVIRMDNVMPDGEEMIGVELLLRRSM